MERYETKSHSLLNLLGMYRVIIPRSHRKSGIKLVCWTLVLFEYLKLHGGKLMIDGKDRCGELSYLHSHAHVHVRRLHVHLPRLPAF
jgi:hypothetical protein